MGIAKRIVTATFLLAVFLFLCVGYAALSETMKITGSVAASPPMPDVYITNPAPFSSAGVTVNYTGGTTIFASVSGAGTATFTIDFINISDKTYIYERVIDGTEIVFDGVYSGDEITYKVSGIKTFDEIAPNDGMLSLDLTITVPAGIVVKNYILKFNFIEKTGTEILPGNDEYDITFKYNNGQADTVTRIHKDALIPRPDTPIRSNYTFVGWYTDETYTTAWNFDVDRVTSPTTLYARWEYSAPEEYRVTFKPNNGEPNTVSVIPADSLIPPPATPVWEGYTFIGWYTDEGCTKAWNFDTDKIHSNMSLYGGWEIYVPPTPPDCNVTFIPNNGEPDTTIVVLTGEFIPRPQTPVRPGYTFTGWYTDEACTTAWNFEANKVEWHTVLYGGWELAEYTVTFKPNNGTPDTTVTVNHGSLIPRPQPPERSDYVFMGWYTDAECKQAWNFDMDVPTANMTLYGGWKKEADPGNSMHKDFFGLVEALLSDGEHCLNDDDLIYDAVIESLNSQKRPEEDAPILHCLVKSISGGTMSSVAQAVNANLSAELHFIFEADADPAYQSSRLRLYMYYADDCNKAILGDEIMVYQQILVRGSDGVWSAAGTYIGTAVVGRYFEGGNAGKDVKTINPYTWRATSTSNVE